MGLGTVEVEPCQRRGVGWVGLDRAGCQVTRRSGRTQEDELRLGDTTSEMCLSTGPVESIAREVRVAVATASPTFWMCGHFAWEYKGMRTDLAVAYRQLNA